MAPRSTILTICKEHGIAFEIRAITRDEIYAADEAFLSGTATQIKPIIEIDSRAMADGTVGKTTKKLQEYYEQIVRGKGGILSKNWLTYIQ